ncbi:MAG: cytochrome c oxidase accessory protein CcoG [Rhodospirillaceae bacterium]|nr:cytochrome c oxidase accessory protein CcoG [Rhodospirillaceae bacterium]
MSPDGSGTAQEFGDAADVLSVREQKADARARAAGDARPPGLYARRVQVYPRKVSGRFRRIKWAALVALLGLYYVLPWVRWDRGPGAPDQAVLVDLNHERGYFFFIEIWPQEVYYLTGILVLAAVGLFLATSLAGRVWCGYACPQTVWTDLFMWVERQIEGDRGARIRLDKQKWSAGKAARKAAKHGAWLAIAFLTGGAWIMYFADAPTVVGDFFTGAASQTIYFFVGLFTATTYLLAGMAREQVCTFMCPWPRFQAAMLDEDSLVVTYNRFRGEPRGPHRKGQAWGDTGHCIDCKQCVAVCPTGIDIRDGLQLECIGCGLCVDSCNDIMAKVGLPPSLIAFDTERRMAQRSAKQPLTYRLIRPRTVLYFFLMLGVAGLMVFALATRDDQGINVLHDRTLFVQMSSGAIQNSYDLKVLNKARTTRNFDLTVEGLPGAQIVLVGRSTRPAAHVIVSAPPDGLGEYRLHVRAPAASVTAPETKIRFVVTSAEGGKTVRETTFRGPKPDSR